MHRPDAIETVEVLVYEGYAALDAVGPFEVFDVAESRGLDVETRLVSLEPSRRVTAGSGLTVDPEGSLGAAPDLLIVPGGGWSRGSTGDGAGSLDAASSADSTVPGVRAELAHGALPDAIAERHAAGSTVASVCSGALLLAAAGLLDKRPATTHRDARDALADLGAEVQDARVVDDGDVLTAGGVTAGLDLALWIVEAIDGPDRAAAVADAIEYECQGTIVDGDAVRAE